MSDTEGRTPQVERSAQQMQAKIDELRAYNDYSHGPRGENLKYKHQGWIDAIQWVLGSDMGEQP